MTIRIWTEKRKYSAECAMVGKWHVWQRRTISCPLSNPANFTPPTRASLFYATRCRKMSNSTTTSKNS